MATIVIQQHRKTNGRLGLYEIPCEMVFIPGFESFSFAIHKDNNVGDSWTVSEFTTGMLVYNDSNKKRCLKKATEKLNTIHGDTLRKLIAMGLKTKNKLKPHTN